MIIPEYVPSSPCSPTEILHNQSALAIKLRLLARPGTVVTSVPYHLGSEDDGHDGGAAPDDGVAPDPVGDAV